MHIQGLCHYLPIFSGKTQVEIMSTSWENARKHARALEARLETKLTSYSKLAAQISSGSSRPSSDKLSEQEEGIGGYKLMEEEIEELLEKVGLRPAFHDVNRSLPKSRLALAWRSYRQPDSPAELPRYPTLNLDDACSISP